MSPLFSRTPAKGRGHAVDVPGRFPFASWRVPLAWHLRAAQLPNAPPRASEGHSMMSLSNFSPTASLDWTMRQSGVLCSEAPKHVAVATPKARRWGFFEVNTL